MASAFDPSRFIANETSRLAALAEAASVPSAIDVHQETAEICGIPPVSEPPLATLATLAAPAGEMPWEQQLRRFVEQGCPRGIRPAFWDELIEEAWSVSREWGGLALDTGWTSLDLFGCNPDPASVRVDRNGLVATITALKTPVQITALDATSAELTCRIGAPMRFRLPIGAGAVHLWEAYRMATGP